MSQAIDTLESRRPFLSMLQTYRITAYPEEFEELDRIEQFVRGNSDCFKRDRREGAAHIAASVFLMDSTFERALFMKHAIIKRWTQPGGHADGHPIIQDVALRELEEETGVRGAILLDPIPFEIFHFRYPKYVFGYTKSIINCFFLAMLPSGQKPRIMEPEKCEELRWANVEEARTMIREIPHDGYERLLEKWSSRLNQMRLTA